ncbi:MAG: hypothetical protein HZB95_13115 [Nitrosomonadales bacterium]|nr:hypothetical protein [Nitrosomonadales bacterium]
MTIEEAVKTRLQELIEDAASLRYGDINDQRMTMSKGTNALGGLELPGFSGQE